MSAIPVLVPEDWSDYELLDSGLGEKLERFASYTLVRPDPRAIWQRSAPPLLWEQADAAYIRTDQTSGEWKIKRPPPTPWQIRYDTLTFTLRPTSFKHVGVFPEQAPNWRWIREQIGGAAPRVLNLFAYTGDATLAAAAAGAQVTHVDSAKSALTWAKENVHASKIADDAVRWIEDDAYKFVLREGRRGATYDAIILDPPRFGRGSKGEVWKIEEDLPKLLAACNTILSSTPLFLLLNAYTADLSSLVLEHLLHDMTGNLGGTVTSGELALQDRSGRLLPNGIFARWSVR